MKALKSDKANSLVSVDWNTMTAKASDGTEYRMSAVSGTPTSGAVERVEKPIDEETREQLEKGRWCVDSGEPMNKWARAYDARFGLDAAPSLPSEAKAGEDA